MSESEKYNDRDLTETILFFLVAYISQTTLANFLPLLNKGKKGMDLVLENVNSL